MAIVDQRHAVGGPVRRLEDIGRLVDDLALAAGDLQDFQIAAEQLYRSVKIPWSSGSKGVIHQEEGLSVEVARGSGVIIKGEQVSEIRWLDTAGTVVFDGNQLGYASSSEGERAYQLDFTKLDGKASQMEITVYTGFRNNR